MFRKSIDRVTVTIANYSIDPQDLVRVFDEYGFVEFGILLSQKIAGDRRFPSLSWLNELYQLKLIREKLPLSGHLCGVWVRDICQGGDLFFQECAFWRMFNRLQLNFHAEVHIIEPRGFSQVLLRYAHNKQIIVQMDGVNDDVYTMLVQRRPTVNVVPLFDLSGGTGILPREWPKANGVYCGYTGGLAPENLPKQMEEIAKAAGKGPIWIDAETQFDLKKVLYLLETAKRWVIGY